MSDKARDMSQFLEFNSTKDTRAGQFARGNPLFNGEFPRRFKSVDGILVNGEDIGASASTVESLHRSLVEAKRAVKHGMAIDAISFIAIYNTPRFHGRFARADTVHGFDLALDELDIDPLAPLRLGSGPEVRPHYRHSVQPIETDTPEQLYIQKLGILGPLCISSMAQAMGIYYCDRSARYSAINLAHHSRSFVKQ